jgi:hypothetical protein
VNIVARRSHIAASGVSVRKGKREREEGKRCGRQRNSERKRRIRVRGIRVYCETKPISLSLSLSHKKGRQTGHMGTHILRLLEGIAKVKASSVSVFSLEKNSATRNNDGVVNERGREGGKEGRMWCCRKM